MDTDGNKECAVIKSSGPKKWVVGKPSIHEMAKSASLRR